MGLKWDQAEEIAEVLMENHPGLDPLQAQGPQVRAGKPDGKEP